MSFYYIGAGLLILALLVFIFLPLYLYRKTAINHAETISNPEIVKQRLVELASEKRESLLSESDYSDAVIETKLHLADELPEKPPGGQQAKSRTGLPVLMLSFAVFVAVSGYIYYRVNDIDQVSNWETVQSQLPELGQRIVVQADSSVTQQELMNFALGLRTKLNQEKEDAVGWLLLGRVLATLRDFEGAILAFNKSLAIEPDRTGALFSLAQTLLVSEDSSNVIKAERLLVRLRQLTPQDNQVLGLLAVAFTRKGEEQKAIETWTYLRGRLRENDPMMPTVRQQLAMLQSGLQSGSQPVASTTADTPVPQGDITEIVVQVSVSPDVSERLPGDGFLFVFVQDADSQMRMPAAVKKQPLAQLDLSQLETSTGITFSLTNADAMLQEFNLSNIKNGRLIARISADENVTLQDGDFQGEMLIPVTQGQRLEHRLIINKEI